jgi:hypothetical protein
MEAKLIKRKSSAVQKSFYAQCDCGQEILEFAVVQYAVCLPVPEYPEVHIYFHGQSRHPKCRYQSFGFNKGQFARFVGNWVTTIPEEEPLVFEDSSEGGGYLVLRNEGYGYFSLSRYANKKKMDKQDSNWDFILREEEFVEINKALEDLYKFYEDLEMEYDKES